VGSSQSSKKAPKYPPMATNEEHEGYKTIMLDNSLQETHLEQVGELVSIKEKCKNRFKLTHQEAWSDKDKQVLQNPRAWRGEHGFVAAVRIAYNHHIPLAFSPDHLWNLIIQGVSEHVNQNAEQLRHHFVNFDGKETLKIYRDGFAKGSEGNDWAGCFDEWVEQIEGFVGSENKETLCPAFSTTDKLAMACTNLGFMDSMKSYFSYECHTMCGIKAVKLFGKLEDWEHLHENVIKLKQYDLEWWIDYIEPVVANIVKTFKEEEVDGLFWQSIYKHHSAHGSGSVNTVDGWIVNFFPYQKGSRNSHLVKLETLYDRALNPPERGMFSSGPGVPESNVPNGISKTDFTWVYYGNNIPMEFHSGFIGAEIEEDEKLGKCVQPVQFWAVAEKHESKKNTGFN